MENKKKIIILDLIFVVGSLFVIALLVGYSKPLVIAPIDELETTNAAVLFEFEKADLILIDDNLKFSSPQKFYAEDNLVINLKPGVYYWKVQGTLGSEIRELTVKSEVDLKLKKSAVNESYEIVNAGNTKLNVDVYENGLFTGNVVLDVDEEEEVSGTKFVGGER